jgi:hypothetical protein
MKRQSVNVIEDKVMAHLSLSFLRLTYNRRDVSDLATLRFFDKVPKAHSGLPSLEFNHVATLVACNSDNLEAFSSGSGAHDLLACRDHHLEVEEKTQRHLETNTTKLLRRLFICNYFEEVNHEGSVLPADRVIQHMMKMMADFKEAPMETFAWHREYEAAQQLLLRFLALEETVNASSKDKASPRSNFQGLYLTRPY